MWTRRYLDKRSSDGMLELYTAIGEEGEYDKLEHVVETSRERERGEIFCHTKFFTYC